MSKDLYAVRRNVRIIETRPRSHFSRICISQAISLRNPRRWMRYRSQFRTKAYWCHAFAWTSEKFRRYRDAERRRESRCWKERVSRNGDNDTMDHGEARFRLHCERRWKQFCRIWVPLPFPIRDAFPKTRSLEVGDVCEKSFFCEMKSD